MSPWRHWGYDKGVFVGVVVAAGLTGDWVWRQQAGLLALQSEPVTPVLGGSAYAGTAWRVPEPTSVAWPGSPAQSPGGDWVYEIFTPPVISYNPAARSFAVTPPGHPAERGGLTGGLELLEVKLEPYRLQLLGYFGSPGDYLAALASAESPDTLLARAGRHLEQWDLSLKSFDVRKVSVEAGEPGPFYEVAALAVLQDERTGAEILLDSRSLALTGKLLAVFQLTGTSGQPCELHEGDTLAHDGATYRIERIQLDPPEVIVARTAPGLPVPELHALRPPPQFARMTSQPKALAPPPSRSVASTGP